MNDVTQWLSSPDKDYQAGVEIYNRYKISNKHDAFFASGSGPDSIQFNQLVYQLRRIAQKLGQAIPQPEPVKKPIKIVPLVPVKEDKPADIDGMRDNTQYVNKLLTMKWEDLNADEKTMFYGNENYFEAKQQVLFEISKKKNEMHAMDQKRKSTKSHALRKQFNEKCNELSKQIRDLFKKKIDTWENPNLKVSQIGIDDVKTAIERERKIRYLKGTALPRAKKELLNKKLTDKQRSDRQNNITAWEKELSELEKIHQL
jgi:hypothetical protein